MVCLNNPDGEKGSLCFWDTFLRLSSIANEMNSSTVCRPVLTTGGVFSHSFCFQRLFFFLPTHLEVALVPCVGSSEAWCRILFVLFTKHNDLCHGAINIYFIINLGAKCSFSFLH